MKRTRLGDESHHNSNNMKTEEETAKGGDALPLSHGGKKDVARVAYEESPEERGQKTKRFIQNLHFSKPLSTLAGQDRSECPKCKRKRLFYCYDCVCASNLETHPPPLKLPIHVNVVFHPGELRSKSTSIAAATISPDISIIEYPNVPESLDPEATLLLYPSSTSIGLDEIPSEELANYKNVVFVDSTWQQSKKIVRDERVTRFRHVKIKAQTSLFWRFQNNDPSYLATVEAIYYFLREYTSVLNKHKSSSSTPSLGGGESKKVVSAPCPSATTASSSNNDNNSNNRIEEFYHGEVDDLLYYYINQYVLIQRSYSTRKAKQQKAADGGDGGENDAKSSKGFTTRHFADYVVEGVDWDELLK